MKAKQTRLNFISQCTAELLEIVRDGSELGATRVSAADQLRQWVYMLEDIE